MRINMFGISVTKTNLQETLQFLSGYDYTKTGYVCLPDLSVLMAATKDKELTNILNNSLLTLPDGKPLELIGKIKGEKGIGTVSGYWLIRELLKSNLKHYFYGGSPVTTKLMVEKLKTEFPDSKILGYASPPLLDLCEIENSSAVINDIENINQLRPDIVWLGISSPKQDYLAYYHSKRLQHGVMICVGGVFDYLSGSKRKSPEWIKKVGLRWLYRLLQEPRRLWKKYFFTFGRLLIILVKLAGQKIYSIYTLIVVLKKKC